MSSNWWYFQKLKTTMIPIGIPMNTATHRNSGSAGKAARSARSRPISSAGRVGRTGRLAGRASDRITPGTLENYPALRLPADPHPLPALEPLLQRSLVKVLALDPLLGAVQAHDHLDARPQVHDILDRAVEAGAGVIARHL